MWEVEHGMSGRELAQWVAEFRLRDEEDNERKLHAELLRRAETTAKRGLR